MITQTLATSLNQNSLLHPDRLYIRKFTNTVSAQLPADAGALHSAERNARVREHHLIDKDHARFEFIDEAFLLALIVGPCAGAEAEPAVVGDANRFLRVFHAENGSHRAKKLFLIGWRILRNIRQDGRRIIISFAVDGLPSGQEFRPGADRFAHVIMK